MGRTDAGHGYGTGVCSRGRRTGDCVWDSVYGQPLDFEGVLRARSEELEEFAKHTVYHKVPIQECYERTGKEPIGTKWVDINKVDTDNPEYRSRLVAMEIRRDTRSALFAATPPLEAKKCYFLWRRRTEWGTGKQTDWDEA